MEMTNELSAQSDVVFLNYMDSGSKYPERKYEIKELQDTAHKFFQIFAHSLRKRDSQYYFEHKNRAKWLYENLDIIAQCVDMLKRFEDIIYGELYSNTARLMKHRIILHEEILAQLDDEDDDDCGAIIKGWRDDLTNDIIKQAS